MTTGKKILTNYRLSDYVTRLRYTAARWRQTDDDLASMFNSRELDEVADVLVDVLNRQSPTQGSGNG